MSKLVELVNFLKTRAPNGIALAFSGGVDSSLLLAVLKRVHDEYPFPLLALTMHSIFQTQKELDEVQRVIRETGVEWRLFGCDPLAIPELKYNPPDRCYWCKSYIFSEFIDHARSRGMSMVIDGTNADDCGTYRPGLAALRETGVVSPLAELGITKREVREIASFLKLDCAEKPSMPCLATRFEYGTLLSEKNIRNVIEGEEAICRIVPSVRQLRLRMHGSIARIEVEQNMIVELATHHVEIADALKSLGFQFITIDMEGFRSGCFDPQNNRQTMEV